MPQIKQCYSLQNRRDKTPNFNFFAAKKSPTKSSPVSICKTSPVTMTTTSAAVKAQVAMPSVPVDSKCIVYLAKAPVPSPTPGTPTNPRPGYLLPVYKTSTREAAYAFVPAGAQRTHRVGDKSMSPLEGRAPNHVRSECSLNGSCTTVGHYVTRPYPSPNSMTALKEVHTGCVPATGKLLSGSQAPPALYSDHIHSKSRVHSCCDLINDASALNPSRTDSVNTTGCSTGGSSKNSLVNILKTITTHSVGLSRGSAIPPSSAPSLVQEISGGTLSASQEKPPYPPLCRILACVAGAWKLWAKERTGAREGDTPRVSPSRAPVFSCAHHFQEPATQASRIQEIAPKQTALNNQEAIFNPMSVYLRAKLVPREVVAVNQGGEPSPPLVEYIKTNAICDKELTKWSVKNVADFIAATDCADKAELFLEQVCNTISDFCQNVKSGYR